MVCRINYRPAFGPVVGYAFKRVKNPLIVASSLCAVDPKAIIAEFESVASRNTRCKTPCAHFVLSPAPGEKLSREQWRELCEATAKEFGAHQWVAALHRDTGCEHVSLVLSRIDLKGKAWSTSNDRYRLRDVCINFEQAHGLTRTSAKSIEPRLEKEELEKSARLYKTGARPDAVPERLKIAVAVKAAMQQSPTLADFERTLLRQKIVTRWRHDEQGRPVGVSYARGEAAISGKNAGITCRALTVYYGTKGTNTYEQATRSEIPGRNPRVDRAPCTGGDPATSSGIGCEHGGTYGGSQGTERFDRGATEIPGINSAVKQVGDLMTQALAGLNLMIEEDVKDGDRFIKRQQPHFPKHKIFRTKGISL